MDYFSGFFELDHLNETVINHLKLHFARHGIAESLTTDNGPQYSSGVFLNFSKKWGFKHTPISPGNSKGNGAAEAAVKTAKKILRKCQADRQDPHLGLLNLRNTPNEGLTTSPSQRLFGRRTRTLLPTMDKSLQPTGNHLCDVPAQWRRKYGVADRSTNRDLPPLTVGDTVRMQPIQTGTREWQPATVVKKLGSRKYEVEKKGGRRAIRNRKHIRLMPESEHSNVDTNQRGMPSQGVPNTMSATSVVASPKPMVTETPKTVSANDDRASYVPQCVSPQPEHYVTRAGRIVKPVQRFDIDI